MTLSLIGLLKRRFIREGLRSGPTTQLLRNRRSERDGFPLASIFVPVSGCTGYMSADGFRVSFWVVGPVYCGLNASWYAL